MRPRFLYRTAGVLRFERISRLAWPGRGFD